MSPPPRRQHTQAFTLIEVMAVMAIIAIMIFAIVPNLDNQVPAYRLKAGARELASEIERAQSEAVGQRKRFILRYDFDRRSFQMLLPPAETEEAEEELDPNDPFAGGAVATPRPRNDLEHGLPPPDPDAPAEEEEEEDEVDPDDLEALPETFLPQDVVFLQIKLNGEVRTSGRVDVSFSHVGNDGAHTVGLTLDSERETRMFVKFNPMTRSIVFSEREPQLRELEGDAP